ncbi:MAG: VCBS repeat-containing protein, partial [Gemmatimonadetes bacterium]|nr:VCBS repeat-containing protein [Gemmatimonadota bacterium]
MFKTGAVRLISTAGLLVLASTASGQSVAGDFVPSYTFRGSQLTGWTPLGQASWRADNGEIVGVPRGGGGWLIMDEPYQDLGFFARFRCAAPCTAGVLLRAQRTEGGLTGVFVSLADGDIGQYRITIDRNGREVSRERLGRAAGLRSAPPPAPPAQAAPPAPPAAPAEFPFGPVPPAGVRLPGLLPPRPGIWPGEWNQISIILDANIVRPTLNGGNQLGTAYPGDQAAGYGPVALYVGGTSEVRFRDVSVKDLNLRDVPHERVSSRFRLQQLDEFSYAWDAAVADVNQDGQVDIVAGPFYYLGPEFTQRREFFLSETHSPGTDYVMNMMAYAHDFNGDRWPDILMGAYGARPMHLYINPRGERRRWDRHVVLPGIASELTLLQDMDADGRPEAIFVADQTLVFAKYDPANPTAWTVHPISERGMTYGHGFGVGDITGDGKLEVLQPAGWWEQPAGGVAAGRWTYHPQEFARWSRSQVAGGGNMAVFDVDGDGRNDVVTSLNAHGWGLAWFKQTRDAGGKIAFERHMIMDDFSAQNAGGVTFAGLHAGVVPADIDADGVLDFVTGKRFWGHLDGYTDADAQSPAVIYWYRTI